MGLSGSPDNGATFQGSGNDKGPGAIGVELGDGTIAGIGNQAGLTYCEMVLLSDPA